MAPWPIPGHSVAESGRLSIRKCSDTDFGHASNTCRVAAFAARPVILSTRDPMSTSPHDSRRFRDALGSFVTGVTIVTTVGADGVDAGLTVNSFASLSLVPPLVLWSLGRESDSWPVFASASHYAVHVLARDQAELSRRFAGNAASRFQGLKLERGAGGVALIDGCCARFECRIAARHEGGDHQILVGEVLALQCWERPPLVYFRGRYAAIG